MQFKRAVPFDVIALQEPIQFGQRAQSFHVDVWDGSDWNTVARGATIGYKKLIRIPRTKTSRVRVVIDAAKSSIALQRLGLYDTAQ